MTEAQHRRAKKKANRATKLAASLKMSCILCGSIRHEPKRCARYRKPMLRSMFGRVMREMAG